jgi:hypothetical protein
VSNTEFEDPATGGIYKKIGFFHRPNKKKSLNGPTKPRGSWPQVFDMGF